MISCNPLNFNKKFNDELSTFTSTKGNDPLAETIWEYNTSEQFNKYLYFSNDTINLFYGMIWDNKLERYSDFFSAPYTLKNGVLYTNLIYKDWYTKEIYDIDIIKSENIFYMNANGEIFNFTEYSSEDIKDLYTLVIVTIQPWN